ncbi:fimbrin fimI [Enterobacterales bacterium]|nr:fimbrin fimI [Enterobacterales bacterium]
MAGACAVSPESEDKNVVMGQVRSNQFHGEIGTWADPVSFSLQLIDCNTAASKQVAMIFNGVADGKDPQVFSAGEGAGAAKGVGIGLFDGQGDLIAPNTRARHSTSLTDGLVTVPFMAKYRSTSRQVTPGDASARVTFSLYYP